MPSTPCRRIRCSSTKSGTLSSASFNSLSLLNDSSAATPSPCQNIRHAHSRRRTAILDASPEANAIVTTPANAGISTAPMVSTVATSTTNDSTNDRINPTQDLANMRHLVDCINDQTTKKNTTKAKKGKQLEYHAFCNHVYGMDHASTRYTVNSEKLYLFLFYQCFRNSKTADTGIDKEVVDP